MNQLSKKTSSTFKTISEGAVKSIRQRQLLRYWERIRGTNALPTWSQIDPSTFSASHDYLCVMEVKREDLGIRYRVREHGKKLGEYYGNACVGRFLDEFMTPEALSNLTAIYTQAVNGQRPVYTMTPITDRRGIPVTFERLLLPFALTGALVDVVLTSLEAISIEGDFEQSKVLEPTKRKVVSGFHGVIEELRT